MKKGKLKQLRPKQKQVSPGLQSKMKPLPQAEREKLSHKLSDKVAIITGGDSGIGRSVAIAFAKEGADIAIIYLKEHSDAKETQKLVEKSGKRCLVLKGDVGKEAFCKSAVRSIVRHFGKVDILVNNAATQSPKKTILEISETQLEHTFRTNIFSCFFMTKSCLKQLEKNKGVIINTTSVTAYRGSKHLLDYFRHKGSDCFLYQISCSCLSRKKRFV